MVNIAVATINSIKEKADSFLAFGIILFGFFRGELEVSFQTLLASYADVVVKRSVMLQV